MSVDHEAEELAQLRRRAYASEADIASDPAALDRLIELETRAASARNAPGSTPMHRDEPGADVVVGAVPPPEGPDEQVPPRARRGLLAVLGAVAAAAVVVAVVSVSSAQGSSVPSGASQLARLQRDPAFEAPAALAYGPADEVAAYAGFDGFRAVTFPSPRGGEDDAWCLVVYQPELFVAARAGGSYSYSGAYMTEGCSAGVFPARATFTLTVGAPELRRTTLPPGTHLQFVYDSQTDEVVVYSG